MWQGRFIMWDKSGRVVAEGAWRHGRPASGVCFVPDLGDAGSAGSGRWGRYEDGKLVESLGHGTAWGNGPPKTAATR